MSTHRSRTSARRPNSPAPKPTKPTGAPPLDDLESMIRSYGVDASLMPEGSHTRTAIDSLVSLAEALGKGGTKEARGHIAGELEAGYDAIRELEATSPNSSAFEVLDHLDRAIPRMIDIIGHLSDERERDEGHDIGGTIAEAIVDASFALTCMRRAQCEARRELKKHDEKVVEASGGAS